MAALKRILVAYDGSIQSRVALSWAILLGRQVRAELDVVKVFEPIHRHYTRGDYDVSEKLAEQYAAMERADRDLMDDVKALCKECRGLKFQVDVLKGPVAATLLDYAHQRKVDLIVTGTKGQGVLEEMLVGSVASTLVSLAKVPVLVVKTQRAPASLQKILVAYDGSDFARAALNQALDIGRTVQAKVSVVKVSDPFDAMTLVSMAESGSAERIREKLAEMDEKDTLLMQEAKKAASLRGLEIDTEFLAGASIADELIRQAEKISANLIVVGTLGHGLLGGMLMGSVTRDLVSISKAPVLVVKNESLNR